MQVYMPHAQMYYPEPVLSLIVRVAGDRDPLSLAGSVREQVRAVDALQPINRLRSFDAIISQSLAARRFTLVLLVAFAVTALVLAVVGLYGALSYLVTQREREIGVRVALGAGSAQIRSLVIRQGMIPTMVGLIAGLLASVGVSRVVESMLYATSARDALTYAAVFMVIGGCALTACLFPARRAAGVDPAVTLRQ
jgi:putative ABC transport system permease protein